MKYLSDRNTFSFSGISQVETVDKILDVLELYLKHEGELSVSELASLSGLSVSRTYRIASSLARRGYLRQKEKRAKYSVGLKLLEYSSVIQHNLRIAELALPLLQKLSRACGESVNVTILDSYEALSVAQVEVNRLFRVSTPVGMKLPLYATSSGKILLAHMVEIERKQFYDTRHLISYTKNTTVSSDKLEEELEIIKRDGVAFDNGEYDPSIWSVAAPVYNSDGNVIAGVAIVAPLARISEDKVGSLIELNRNSALEISTEMGYAV